MLSEKIIVNREGDAVSIPVHSIILPDMRLFLCYLDTQEEVIRVMRANLSAHNLLRKIRGREEKNKCEELFRIDVPDFWHISARFRREERAIIQSFWFLYDALVHHFLPWAETSSYDNQDGEPLGKRYEGLGWYSRSNKEVENLD